MHITPELIKQAKRAENVEELLALARENGVELTAEEAQKYYELWHASAELSDEELDSVAGGCNGPLKILDGCPYCGSKDTTFVKGARVAKALISTYKCNGCGKTFTA